MIYQHGKIIYGNLFLDTSYKTEEDTATDCLFKNP